jgi:hypothetical protein
VHQLVLHTSVEALAQPDEGDDAGPGSVLQAPGGPAMRVHPATARRLGCDCPATAMTDDADGAAIHLGRRSRRIRGRLRRAVEARDRGRCRAPGCTARACQIHHIRHWAHGGSTCLANLISLCEQHHWLVHEGGWRIAVPRPGGWVFLGPDGQRVSTTPPAACPSTPLQPDPDIAADAVTGRWCGERLDPDPILAMLQCSAEHSAAPVTGHARQDDGSRCSAEHSSGPPDQFDDDTLDRWLANLERTNRDVTLQDVIQLDD